MQKGKELLYLSRQDVCAVNMAMREYVDILERAFTEKGRGGVQMPPKSEVRPVADGFLHAMPCAVPAMNLAGLKWLGGFFGNEQKGLPFITGLIVLNCPETGVPLAIMDCTHITAMRTAAVNGLAARHLANRSSKTVAVIGCGLQGRTNLDAVLTECAGIENIYAWSRTRASAERYATEMEARFGKAIHLTDTPREAVELADVLVVGAHTSTEEDAKLIEAGWLRPGVTVLPVNQDSTFKAGVLQSTMDKIYIDDTEMFLRQQQGGFYKGLPGDLPELAAVLTGEAAGRQSADERIALLTVGVGLCDITTGTRVFELALERGIGTRLPL